MFLIDYLKYDIVGKYYIFYIIIVVILIFAVVGIIGEIEIKRKSEIFRIRREKKAEEEGKKAEAAIAEADGEFKQTSVAIDPTLKPAAPADIPVVEPQDAMKNPLRQISSTAAPVSTSLAPDGEPLPDSLADMAKAAAKTGEIGEKPKDDVLVIE